jgi:hypothetical protein
MCICSQDIMEILTMLHGPCRQEIAALDRWTARSR